MARFKTWHEMKYSRFVVAPSVVIAIGIEGNWASLPKEDREKISAIADILQEMVEKEMRRPVIEIEPQRQETEW